MIPLLWELNIERNYMWKSYIKTSSYNTKTIDIFLPHLTKRTKPKINKI